MKLNIFEKGAHALLEDALFKTLKQVYTGEHLYAEIDQISLDYISDDLENDEPIITARIRFGRYAAGEKLNFSDEVEITDIGEEVDISFFTGRFFQYITTTEPKYIEEK